MFTRLCRFCRSPFTAKRRSAAFCSSRCRVRHHRDPRKIKKSDVTLNGNSVSLRVVPLNLKEANAAVTRWHRHHDRVQGHRFSLGVIAGDEIRGTAIVGRPIARLYDARSVAEITRLVTDGTPNVASMLYGRCARTAKEMGFELIQTYIQDHEPGTSLRAAGWILADTVKSRDVNWGKRSKRGFGRVEPVQRQRWIKRLNGPATRPLVSSIPDSSV